MKICDECIECGGEVNRDTDGNCACTECGYEYHEDDVEPFDVRDKVDELIDYMYKNEIENTEELVGINGRHDKIYNISVHIKEVK